MKTLQSILVFSFTFLVACSDQTNERSSPNKSPIAPATKSTAKTPAQIPKKPALVVKDWAFAVPLPDIANVNLWKRAGAKNTPNNEILRTLSESTRVGILGKKSLASGSVYFHVELEDGTRGFIGRPFISRDALGNAFYERNSKTGEVLRDVSGYSYSHGENCILHVAALMTGDLRKGEFETTAEFEQRKRDVASTIPWFSNDLTYTYVYSFSGKYDADKQTFDYRNYDVPDQDDYTEYSSDYRNNKKIPYIEFDNDCTSEFGYQFVEYEEDYRKRVGRSDTLLRVINATLPRNFLDPKYASIGSFGVRKKISRERAPDYKNVDLYFGVKPTAVQSVRKGSNYGGYSAPDDHITRLTGTVSYLFLITKDGKNVVESYVSSDYEKSWQKDLQSQLTIAGYDVGLIDGFAGDATKGAVESAVKDGILPNAEVSMRSTMLLIGHNRKMNR